jgi:hypothetical protein
VGASHWAISSASRSSTRLAFRTRRSNTRCRSLVELRIALVT